MPSQFPSTESKLQQWDAGMATRTHTPEGRGYETSLAYFHHGNSYWSDETGDLTCPVGVDLWDTDHPAHGLVPQQNKVDQWNETAYEEHFFMLRLLQILDSYTPSDENPLFLFYAAHLVHDPLFVPQQYLNNMSKVVETSTLLVSFMFWFASLPTLIMCCFQAGGGPIDNTTANDNTRLTYHAMT